MSYEGYVQFLCAQGHLNTRDAYDEGTPLVCDCVHPKCRAPFVWRHDVDQTNDEGEEAMLKIKTKVKYDCCPTCDHESLSKAATYHIPDKAGQKLHSNGLSVEAKVALEKFVEERNKDPLIGEKTK